MAILEGDVNKDGKVDIFDLARVGKAFGTKPGDLYWDSDADLNRDEKIDIIDLATVGLHYGDVMPDIPNPPMPPIVDIGLELGQSGYYFYGSWWYAQPFVPTAKKMNAVDIYIGFKSGTSADKPITLGIRTSQTGSDIATSTLQSNEIKTGWNKFMFPLLSIIPGNKYYLVLRSPEQTRTIQYWRGGSEYPYLSWGSPDSGASWFEHERTELVHNLAFRTYTYFV